MDLELKIKEMEFKHKEQEKAIDKMANEEEFQAKVKAYNDELRVWKEKVKKLKDL